MLLRPRLRRRRSAHRRNALAILLLLFLLDAFFLIRGRPSTHTNPTLPHDRHTRVFIASIHRNNGPILRASWNDAVMRLVSLLGPENIHFSAVESGSQDDTKEALMELKGSLDAAGVSNDISLGSTVWEQLDELWNRPDPNGERQPGWIWNPEDGVYDMRRIPYLARVRNQAMEPLKRLEGLGRRFDKVFWLNDVVFDTEDFLTLLNTRDGRYAAACSMDFGRYPSYYDTFALRDETGEKTASLYWPWFTSPVARASAGRAEPVEVFSCWNGMVLFDATPFYAEPPLRFRGIDDSLADMHLEGSECCLIHADNNVLLSNRPADGGGGGGSAGVWLNPNVRVAYKADTYRDVKGGRFPGPIAAVVGFWANRLSRATHAIQSSLERRAVLSRLAQWVSETPPGEALRTEPGAPCLINEEQIMWMNGWRHL